MSTQTASPAPAAAAAPGEAHAFHRIEAPLSRARATSLVDPDNLLRVIVTVDPHELVAATGEHSTDLPELDVLAGLALLESDHGMVMPCQGTWHAVGYVGDGLIEVAFSFDYFASCEGLDDEDPDEEECDTVRLDAMYRAFIGEEPAFVDVPLPLPELEAPGVAR